MYMVSDDVNQDVRWYSSPNNCQMCIFILEVLKSHGNFNNIFYSSRYVKFKNILLGVNCWNITISEWGKSIKQIHNHEQEKSFKFVICSVMEASI